MCGTAPSLLWYIQHLVQDRDLVQHHDLEPQEEQSWQQQNIEDTKNNYDSFFDVVKTDENFEESIETKHSKPQTLLQVHMFFQCFKIWSVSDSFWE